MRDETGGFEAHLFEVTLNEEPHLRRFRRCLVLRYTRHPRCPTKQVQDLVDEVHLVRFQSAREPFEVLEVPSEFVGARCHSTFSLEAEKSEVAHSIIDVAIYVLCLIVINEKCELL